MFSCSSEYISHDSVSTHCKYNTKQHVKGRMLAQANNPDITMLRTLPAPMEIKLLINPVLFYTDNELGEGDLHKDEDEDDADVNLMISWHIWMIGDDEGNDFSPIRTTSIGLIPIKNLLDFKPHIGMVCSQGLACSPLMVS